MRLKAIATMLMTATLLSACGVAVKNNNSQNTPIVFTEPAVTPPFYALNPFNYAAPPAFEVDLKQAHANKLIVPTVDSNQANMKFAPAAGHNELDVTQIDDFLQLVEGKARHYPPQFTNRNERRGFETKLREISVQLDALAANRNASYDVLIRAFKVSVMARNLDMGTQFTTKSLQYAQRLIKMSPNDPTTNFWFGFSLSEGGGQREAIPYLDKAIKGGVQEAYLSAVNNYLFLEQRRNALSTLHTYKVKYPEESKVVDRLVMEIEKQGRTNVWENLTAMKQGHY
ncbi:ABUW_2363 family tetratricopeptide repeat lipoprotein [Acinetobacter sp. MB5]|uniref:ABUW_2363 family tetratricopeptide repeat lipoprotein n=1 Tax=Acinetobacter sp. MB5 TaxID=2069438 RepID=UPI000DCF986E|nr:hypothetical protein [Acinetobacter sp. MB5]